jgi:hypothetical protein
MAAKKTPKARLDADKTAKPKTRILGRHPEGHCFGGSATPFALEDTETGERIPLHCLANPDWVLILVGSMKGCLSSIAAHVGDVTPDHHRKLEALYRQILAIQDEVNRKPV